MKYIYIIFIMSLSILNAKEVFTFSDIKKYLNEENPFFYSTISKENNFKNEYLFYEGKLDNKAFVKYEEKNYPIGEAEYLNLGIKKKFESGIEYSASYRKTEGTQEYNNIKTPDNGEINLDIKVPLLSVIEDVNKIKTDIENSLLKNKENKMESQNNLRFLYYEVITNYINVLYTKDILKLKKDLLKKSIVRKKMIEDKIKLEQIPKVSIYEINQQILNREQEVENGKNNFNIALNNFLKYLNIDKDEFNKKYSFLNNSNIDMKELILEEYIDIAINNRPDLKKYQIELNRLKLKQKQDNLLSYPELDLYFKGIYDENRENGFKIGINVEFPFERNQYKSKTLENNYLLLENNAKLEKKIINIKNDIKNILINIGTLKKNRSSIEEEIKFLEKLEEIEEKKYFIGSSNLFFLNQREIMTLEKKEKRLKYKYKHIDLLQELKKETNSF